MTVSSDGKDQLSVVQVSRVIKMNEMRSFHGGNGNHVIVVQVTLKTNDFYRSSNNTEAAIHFQMR